MEDDGRLVGIAQQQLLQDVQKHGEDEEGAA